MPIAIDDPTSWPPAIVGALEEALPVLRGYQERRARIDLEWETRHQNPAVRFNLPKNPFRPGRESLAAKVEELIANLSILAWHCTRLCDDEIAAVMANGMFLLSPETFDARVQSRLHAGDITATVADRLRAENQASNEHRVGQVWFVLTRKLLRDSGVADLLGYWGGEALYNSHDRDPIVGPILMVLGKPCIVELAVPYRAIRGYRDLGMNIVRTFELAHGLKDENPPDCEGHTRQAIPPEQVLRIITPDNEDFVAITAERD